MYAIQPRKAEFRLRQMRQTFVDVPEVKTTRRGRSKLTGVTTRIEARPEVTIGEQPAYSWIKAHETDTGWTLVNEDLIFLPIEDGWVPTAVEVYSTTPPIIAGAVQLQHPRYMGEFDLTQEVLDAFTEPGYMTNFRLQFPPHSLQWGVAIVGAAVVERKKFEPLSERVQSDEKKLPF